MTSIRIRSYPSRQAYLKLSSKLVNRLSHNLPFVGTNARESGSARVARRMQTQKGSASY